MFLLKRKTRLIFGYGTADNVSLFIITVMTQPNFITVFADATVDTAFKRIFGTEQFKDATIGLLNSFIEGREIQDVTFLNTEILPDAYDGKKSIIDILCTDTDGARFIVEMQKAKQKNFFQRTFLLFLQARIIIRGECGGMGLQSQADIRPVAAGLRSGQDNDGRKA